MAAKAVLDTQIVIGGIVHRRESSAVEIFRRACRASDLVAVTSPSLLAEVERILKLGEIRRLARPPLDDELIRQTLLYIARRFEVVPGAFQNVDQVPTDARDNPIVEAALEAGAEAIVSDDDDLLSLKVIRVRGFRSVQIFAPGPYLKLLG